MFGSRTTISGDSPASEKEWRLIEKLVMTHSQELKKARRWGVLFKLLTFAYLFILLAYFWNQTQSVGMPQATGGHTAVVNVSGVIAAGELAGADSVIGALRRAVEHPDTKAVVLRINSPGGSPVQSAYIYNEIDRLEALHGDIPFYAVVADTGASGAYYIASAAQDIYANGASLIGSIGVTAVGFGFQEAIEKLGVERRQYVSGEHKAFLDPFKPIKPEEKALFESLLANVHEQFIRDVKQGRGERLAENDKLFSGLMWSGEQALELGLVDGLKSTSELARELNWPEIVDFTARPSPFEQFTRNLGLSIAEGVSRISGQITLDSWQLQ